MNKGLEAFNRIKSYFHPKQLLTKEMTLNDLDTIEKELKALEIIKNNCDVENIIAFCVNNEKERDLLKEVLM